jgi:hypothetical protein
MPHQEISLSYPCDKKAIGKFLKKERLEFKTIRRNSPSCKFLHKAVEIYITGTFISIGPEFARFESDYAKEYEGKEISHFRDFNGICISFSEQERIFKRLRSVIEKARKEYLKENEKEMQKKKEQRDKVLAEINKVIDYENEVIKQEHKLEEQINKAISLIKNLFEDMPEKLFSRKSYTKRVEVTGSLVPNELKWEEKHFYGEVLKEFQEAFEYHLKLLNEILIYLKENEIEAVRILNEANQVDIKNISTDQKEQKRHIKKLAYKIKRFVQTLKQFIKDIKHIQVTSEMRNHLKDIYQEIYNIFNYYIKVLRR